MENRPENEARLLLAVIVNHGQGSKVLRAAHQAGLPGGTVLLGLGTACRRQSDRPEACDIRREIVLLVSGRTAVARAAEQLNQVLKLDRPGHGVAFTLAVSNLAGQADRAAEPEQKKEGMDRTMEQAIFVIVDKGEAEAAVQAAETAGARGATIINGRGAGAGATSRLFAMDIEPEKEIVLILADSGDSGAIARAIASACHLDGPDGGFLFAVDADRTYGLIREGI